VRLVLAPVRSAYEIRTFRRSRTAAARSRSLGQRVIGGARQGRITPDPDRPRTQQQRLDLFIGVADVEVRGARRDLERLGQLRGGGVTAPAESPHERRLPDRC